MLRQQGLIGPSTVENPSAKSDNPRVQACLDKYADVKVPTAEQFDGRPKEFSSEITKQDYNISEGVSCVKSLTDTDYLEGETDLLSWEKNLKAALKDARAAAEQMKQDMAANRGALLEGMKKKFAALEQRSKKQGIDAAGVALLQKDVEAFSKEADEKDLRQEFYSQVQSLQYKLSHLEGQVATNARKALIEDVKANVVVARLPGYSKEDIYDVEKIVAAFKASKRGDFVYLENKDKAQSSYFPTPKHMDDAVPHSSWRDYRSAYIWKGIPPYDRSEGFSMGPGLKPNVPALIWYIDEKGYAVTVDVNSDVHRSQLTYRGKLTFSRGLPPDKEWEAFDKKDPPGIFSGDIAVLEEAGQVPKGTIAKLQKIAKDIDKCSMGVWSAADPQFEQIRVANITQSTRENRYESLYERLWAKADRACARHVGNFKSAYGSVAKKRIDTREKTASSLREHLKSLGGADAMAGKFGSRE